MKKFVYFTFGWFLATTFTYLLRLDNLFGFNLTGIMVLFGLGLALVVVLIQWYYTNYKKDFDTFENKFPEGYVDGYYREDQTPPIWEYIKEIAIFSFIMKFFSSNRHE